ncbi:TPA: DUF1380 family protein [Escherichia coli]|uniref:DUF1380 family protein n=1 Tax=Escherichia coli TaxID=562 RepID=UPI00202F7F70|nr:DUF1380 family protein [Escherichia coli]MDI0642585.1 DUF1380 domain-containing protein [Escherichia coli]MDI0829151.1 DUF1380 domain-containing protein [Escherichia coli]MDI0912647.1 DUF1380 domain-containing protein [Escherichia coli]MDI0979854.1 DUF1380 domain-containing protein [Escherichia coli]MDI0984879.1 DUF1380 domain-containing protein [Escherichia coli]
MCLLNAWHARRCIAPIACSWRRIPKFWNWIPASKIEKETSMYGTCETLCRDLAAQYPGDTPLMLVVWSPEEIQTLADGMDISLSDHEIRTILARLEDIPEDRRIESGISSAAAMEIISNVSENRQVTVPAVMLEKVMALAGSEMKRLYAVGSENGGDGDAFVREEREAMDVVLQALDGEHMS